MVEAGRNFDDIVPVNRLRHRAALPATTYQTLGPDRLRWPLQPRRTAARPSTAWSKPRRRWAREVEQAAVHASAGLDPASQPRDGLHQGRAAHRLHRLRGQFTQWPKVAGAQELVAVNDRATGRTPTPPLPRTA